MRKLIKRLLPFYRKVNLLSQSNLDSQIASIMALKTTLPLKDAIISKEDMSKLCEGLRKNISLHPIFIKHSHARYLATGFYPILSFREIPELEIHYPNYYMNDAVKVLWDVYFCERIHNTTIIITHLSCARKGVVKALWEINTLMFKKKKSFVEIEV